MSDTPRTDARRGFHGWYTAVDAEFSEKLERELNAANDGIKRLEEENNELRAEEARLLNTNGELERRIKRLEEALDKTTKIGSKHIKRLEEGGDKAILDSYLPDRLAVWNQAKEAKL